jgi:hypothetical protein
MCLRDIRFNELLLNFSRLMSLSLYKYGMQWVIDHAMMPPAGAWAALRAAADLFGRV